MERKEKVEAGKWGWGQAAELMKAMRGDLII